MQLSNHFIAKYKKGAGGVEDVEKIIQSKFHKF